MNTTLAIDTGMMSNKIRWQEMVTDMLVFYLIRESDKLTAYDIKIERFKAVVLPLTPTREADRIEGSVEIIYLLENESLALPAHYFAAVSLSSMEERVVIGPHYEYLVNGIWLQWDDIVGG